MKLTIELDNKTLELKVNASEDFDQDIVGTIERAKFILMMNQMVPKKSVIAKPSLVGVK